MSNYFYFLFFFYAALHFTASILPLNESLHPKIQNADKIIHLIMFLCFSFLLSLWMFNQKKNPSLSKHWFSYSFIVSVLYGILEETIQYFLPYRTADLADLGADFGGVFLGTFSFRVLLKVYLRGKS